MTPNPSGQHAAFTPGPWKMDLHPFGPLSQIMAAEVESDESIICAVWDNADTESALANARLIAAAPEMYDMLIEARQCLNHGDQAALGINELLSRITP